MSVLASPEFRWIAVTHIVLAISSVAAPLFLWRRYEVTAVGLLTVASIAWLFGGVFHFYLLLEPAWRLWAVPRVVLSVLTLVVVLLYAIRRAREAT
jgi:hypothetical protein